jgi:hypothetical protein
MFTEARKVGAARPRGRRTAGSEAVLAQNVGVRELVMPALLVRVQADPNEPETEHPNAEEVAEEAADALENGDARPGSGINDAETEQMLTEGAAHQPPGEHELERCQHEIRPSPSEEIVASGRRAVACRHGLRAGVEAVLGEEDRHRQAVGEPNHEGVDKPSKEANPKPRVGLLRERWSRPSRRFRVEGRRRRRS